MKYVQVDSVIQADPNETSHLTNTGVTSYIMNEENRPPYKERDRTSPLSQNSTNPQKSKTSVFIVEHRMIKNGYLLTSSLKHQYLLKTRSFSTAKTIDMYDYIKPIQRDFKQEIFILHVGTNDLPLNKSPKETSEDIELWRNR